MSGRYKNDNTIRHPAFEQGVEASADNDEKHQDLAKEMRPRRGLSAAEKRVWNRIAPELSKSGRLKSIFVDFVVEYCVVKVRIDDARSTLDINNWTYTVVGRNGEQHKSRPEVAQYNDDWRKWNSLVAQLGMSPGTELRFNDVQGNLFPAGDGFSDL